tara:strand:+ start:7151 stop:8836 length:1686 start_codon:yes stop_codon:yes gene_type:complete
MEISAKGKQCIARVKLDSSNTQLLSGLPGFHRWINRDMLFSPTGANINYIAKHWPDAQWSSEARVFLNSYIDTLEEATKNRTFETPPIDDFAFETKPFEHQRKAFYMSRDKENFALLMEQGTGKTKIIIDNAAYLYGRGKINCLIVIAPNGVHRNWLNNEIPVHMPKWCPIDSIYYQSGMNKSHTKKFNDVIASKEVLKIFTFNVEAFVSKTAMRFLENILLSHDCLLVVDESSRIKTPGTHRTKVITKLGKLAKYKRILTGTPVTKGAEDVFAQFKFLDPYILGHDSFYSFRARYCVMREYDNRKWIVGYQNVDELTNSIKGHSFRVLKKDCLDLPEKIYQRAYVELSKEQRQIYNSIKNEYVAQLGDDEISVPETITRILRLQQVVCGWFPSENEVKPINKTNLRLKALLDIISEIDSKIIIWARFRADIMAIQAALGDSAVVYYGDVSSDDRVIAVDRFQKDPKIKYFIGQPQSGGIGLTLTAAQYAIYYSNSFDLETRLQSEDRCHRIGTTTNVTYIDLEASKTVDGRIIKALRDKKSVADIVNEDPRSMFLEMENE